MPWGQSEGTKVRWDSNTNCGIDREEKKRESYPEKSPNLRQCQARSQNKGLSRARWLWTGPSPTGDNQAGGSQSWKGAIAASERHPLPNCKQAQLLTKSSWDSGWWTSAWRVMPEISSPEETHSTPEKVHPLYTQKTERLGGGRW